MVLYAELFASNGRIAAEIDDNRPYTNASVIGISKRTSESSLTLKDEHGAVILSGDYIKRNTVKIIGTFY